MEAGCFGEATKIAIAGQQGNSVVKTALSDERITETRFSPLRQKFCAQLAGPLPITWFDLKKWEFQ